MLACTNNILSINLETDLIEIKFIKKSSKNVTFILSDINNFFSVLQLISSRDYILAYYLFYLCVLVRKLDGLEQLRESDFSRSGHSVGEEHDHRMDVLVRRRPRSCVVGALGHAADQGHVPELGGQVESSPQGVLDVCPLSRIYIRIMKLARLISKCFVFKFMLLPFI